MYVTAVKF
jgi:hypothetical protein